MKVRILKIDQKDYIWNLLKVEKMTSCHATIIPIKTRLFISINQAGNDKLTNLIIISPLIL